MLCAILAGAGVIANPFVNREAGVPMAFLPKRLEVAQLGWWFDAR
jgi:hypothetical protein